MLSFYKAGFKKIFNIGKKIFLIVAVYFIIISLFVHFINKDKPTITQDPIKRNRVEIYKMVNDPELNKTKEGKITIAVYKTITCGVIGEACTNNPDDGNKNYKNSLTGKLTNLLILPLANPPASGVMWAYTGLQSAGFIPKTYAAEGFGFATIRPYAAIWKIFRDVAYMFLVLILVALGFMIMFRMKLNPQTVISIENALPRIVVALILITFSFAIAGFMIDLMYVSIIIIISILSNGNTYYNATQFQNEFIVAQPLKLWSDATARAGGGSLIPTLAGSLLGLFPQIVVSVIRSIFGFLTIILLHNPFNWTFLDPIAGGLNDITAATVGIGKIPGAILKPFLGILVWGTVFLLGVYVVFPLIAYILLGGTFLFLCLRIFALLFMSYIKLLLNIILSPFLLMFEAIPGKSSFTSWLKNIIGYLMVFPITVAVFLIGYIIINTSLPAGYNDIHFPYLTGIDSNSFKILIGVGLIILIPDLVKAAKEALGIKELPINFGVGTFFGGAGAVAGGGMGLLGQVSTMSLGLGAFRTGGIFGKHAPVQDNVKLIQDVLAQTKVLAQTDATKTSKE